MKVKNRSAAYQRRKEKARVGPNPRQRNSLEARWLDVGNRCNGCGTASVYRRVLVRYATETVPPRWQAGRKYRQGVLLYWPQSLLTLPSTATVSMKYLVLVHSTEFGSRKLWDNATRRTYYVQYETNKRGVGFTRSRDPAIQRVPVPLGCAVVDGSTT